MLNNFVSYLIPKPGMPGPNDAAPLWIDRCQTKPLGMLKSMGSQRVGHDWATEQQTKPPQARAAITSHVEPWTSDIHSRWVRTARPVLLGHSTNLLDGQLLSWGHRGPEGQVSVQSHAASNWHSSESAGLQGPHSKPGVHLRPDHLGSFTRADSDLGAWDSAFLAGSQVMHTQRPLWEYEWWKHYIILLPFINE